MGGRRRNKDNFETGLDAHNKNNKNNYIQQ
jgi:hypothetical protein